MKFFFASMFVYQFASLTPLEFFMYLIFHLSRSQQQSFNFGTRQRQRPQAITDIH